MVHSKLCAALNHWLWVTSAQDDSPIIMTHAILSWQNQKLAQALCWWYWGTDLMTPMERWIVDNTRHRELQWALHIWRYLTEYLNVAQTSCFHALLKWHMLHLHRSFSTWRSHTHERSVIGEGNRVATLAQAFGQWRWCMLQVMHANQVQVRAYQAAIGLAHVNVWLCWNTWRGNYQDYQKLMLSTVQWCRHQLFTTLERWLHSARDWNERRVMMSGALLSWVKSQLELSVAKWRLFAHQVTICGGALSKWTETCASTPGSPDVSVLSPQLQESIKSSLLQVQHTTSASTGIVDQATDSPNLLVHSLLDWHLRIEHAEISCLEDGTEIVLYHVSTWNDENGLRLRAKKTYTDIESMNRDLTEQYPQMFAYDDSPQLPSKRYYGTMDLHFVNSRKVALEKYLQDVIAIPLLAQAQATRAFFNLEGSMTY